MSSYKTDDIRTIALLGHEVAGKTSIADALLFKAKAVDRRGCVDEGSSVSDSDEQEKQLKYSIDSSLRREKSDEIRCEAIICRMQPIQIEGKITHDANKCRKLSS